MYGIDNRYALFAFHLSNIADNHYIELVSEIEMRACSPELNIFHP